MTCGVLLLSSVLLTASPQGASCADAASCRQAALEASAKRDFETFHDLAWRAVQTGRRTDPELMYLLARAQSLSGRPGDALVMLRRLAGMGFATDAAEDDDFASVRRLPAWPEFETLVAGLTLRPLAAETPVSTPGEPSAAHAAAPAAAPPAAPRRSAAPASPPAPPPAASPPAGAITSPRLAATPVPAAGGEAARRLTAAAVDPIGLAYDTTSRRFIVGDRRANKLIVADEVFDHVNDLIGALAGGFGSLTALGIDSRRGDLWVASRGPDGTASIHKLQLVSGRMLSTLEVPEAWRPAAFSDLAITDAGTLLLLDEAGSRLITLKANARTFDRAVRLAVRSPSSLALNGERAFVAHEAGLSVGDTASGRLAEIRTAEGMRLDGLQRIRWHSGSLIGIQRLPDGRSRLVRIRLSGGRTPAAEVELLDDSPAAEGAALTISRDAAYYVVDENGAQVIRRVPLK